MLWHSNGIRHSPELQISVVNLLQAFRDELAHVLVRDSGFRDEVAVRPRQKQGWSSSTTYSTIFSAISFALLLSGGSFLCFLNGFQQRLWTRETRFNFFLLNKFGVLLFFSFSFTECLMRFVAFRWNTFVVRITFGHLAFSSFEFKVTPHCWRTLLLCENVMHMLTAFRDFCRAFSWFFLQLHFLFLYPIRLFAPGIGRYRWIGASLIHTIAKSNMETISSINQLLTLTKSFIPHFIPPSLNQKSFFRLFFTGIYRSFIRSSPRFHFSTFPMNLQLIQMSWAWNQG